MSVNVFFVSAADLLLLLLQQSAERCVSTLLDLIQTKVNYVVQEAIVVIRDIFRKYPNKCVFSSGGRGSCWAEIEPRATIRATVGRRSLMLCVRSSGMKASLRRCVRIWTLWTSLTHEPP